MHSTSQPKQRRKASDAAMASSTRCTMTISCADTDNNTPLSSPMDTCSDLAVDETEGQGTHGSSTATAVSTAAAKLEPNHTVTSRPTRIRCRPARFVETVRSRRLPDRNHSASSTCCPLASSDVDALCCRHLSVSGCSGWVAETKTVAFVRSCLMSLGDHTLQCVDDMAAPREHVDSESGLPAASRVCPHLHLTLRQAVN